MLGDYPKTSDGVDRRQFSWSTSVSATAGPLSSLLAQPFRPPLPPSVLRPSSTALQPAAEASALGAIAAPAAALPDRVPELMAPPPKAPTSLARIRLGEHTVLWQRSYQARVRPTAGYGVAAAAAASPAPTQSGLVDYPDTAPRDTAKADDAQERDYDVPVDELPDAPQWGPDDVSAGPPQWMLQQRSPEEQRRALPRTNGDRVSPPRDGRATSGQAVEAPTGDAQMPNAPATQAEASAEPAGEPTVEPVPPQPPQAADDDQHQSDALQQTAAEEQPTVSDVRADLTEPAKDSGGTAKPGSVALHALARDDGTNVGPSQTQNHSPREPNGEAARRQEEVTEASGEDHADRPAKRCACKFSSAHIRQSIVWVCADQLCLPPWYALPESVHDDGCQLQGARPEIDRLRCGPHCIQSDNGVCCTCTRQKVQPRTSGGGGGKKHPLSHAAGPAAATVAGRTVFETTRSGRVRLPPLAFWCNQTVVKVPLAQLSARQFLCSLPLACSESHFQLHLRS